MARHLNLLTELKLLDLSGTGLTDSGVADLFRPTLYDRTKGLKNLAHFSVSHCHVTITTFRLLRKLSSIKTIDLSCTNTKQSELESLLGFRLQDDDKDNVWFLLPQEEIEYNFPWFDNVDEKKLAGLVS